MEAKTLDASVLDNLEQEKQDREIIKRQNIVFEFPAGFTPLRLIEECRALNCLDFSNSDNFDFMFDITMQMLAGKAVIIKYRFATEEKELARFVVTNRYMDLRGVSIIDEYPVIVNWLVEFVSAELTKKYPRSYRDVARAMSARKDGRLTSQ